MLNTLLQFNSLGQLAHALSARKLSATELAQDCLKQIPEQASLNAFVDVNAELTLAQARAADAALAAGTAGPLTGIPIAHKDLFVTEGWRSTAGSNMLKDYISPFDATVVRKLREAGCVSLGKLNCDEFAMGSGNEHSAFGPVRHGFCQRKLGLWRGLQPLERRACARRLLGRLSRCRGSQACDGHDGHRHRRLSQTTRCAMRRKRD